MTIISLPPPNEIEWFTVSDIFTGKLYFQYIFTAWMVRACQVQPYTKMEAVRIPRTRLQQHLFMKSHLADNAFSVFVDCFTTLLCGKVYILQNVGRFFNKLFEIETFAIHNCVRLIFAWRLNVALDVFSTSTSASIMHWTYSLIAMQWTVWYTILSACMNHLYIFRFS